MLSSHAEYKNAAEFLTIKEAARRYSVSTDWLYRNNRIPKVYLGRRMVRVSVTALDNYFKEHEI